VSTKCTDNYRHLQQHTTLHTRGRLKPVFAVSAETKSIFMLGTENETETEHDTALAETKTKTFDLDVTVTG